MKLIFFVLLLILVLFNFANAEPVEVEAARIVYMPGETYQAFVGYNVGLRDEVSSANLEFRREGIEVPLALSYISLNDSLGYVYFDFPTNLGEGNYSLVIKDLIYIENNVLVQRDFVEDIDLSFGDGSIVAINPGIIKVNSVWNENIFQIYLTNNGDSNLRFNITSSGYISLSDKEIVLNSGDNGYFSVYVDAFEANEQIGYVNLDYGDLSYIIPVWLPILETEVEEIESVEEGADLRFLDLDKIEQVLTDNESIAGPLRIRNYGNSSLENLIFSVSNGLKNIVRLNLSTVNIGAGETVEQYIWINEESLNVGTYIGILYLANNVVNISLPFNIEIVEQEKEERVIFNRTLENTSFVNESEFTDVDEEGNGSSLWIILAVVVVISSILGYFYYNKKKRKKLEKISSFED